MSQAARSHLMGTIGAFIGCVPAFAMALAGQTPPYMPLVILFAGAALVNLIVFIGTRGMK